jgi:hypothetical protein
MKEELGGVEAGQKGGGSGGTRKVAKVGKWVKVCVAGGRRSKKRVEKAARSSSGTLAHPRQTSG